MEIGRRSDSPTLSRVAVVVEYMSTLLLGKMSQQSYLGVSLGRPDKAEALHAQLIGASRPLISPASQFLLTLNQNTERN
jgi:hypothetical protein